MARLISQRTAKLSALAAVVLAALAVSPAVASDAPSWSQLQGGPAHPGTVGVGPAPPYREAWSFPAPKGGLSGAVVWGHVVISVGEHSVYGIDLGTGRERWTLNRNGGPLSMPAVGSDGKRQILVFIDGSNASGTNLVGVDLETRREIWRIPLKASSRSGVTIDGASAFVGDTSGNLYGIDLASGNVRWTAKGVGSIDAPPAAEGGTVFAVSRATSSSSGSSGVQVLAVGEADGRKEWDYTPRVAGTTASVPAVSGGAVVVGFADRVIRALDAKGGSERWGSLANSVFSPVSSPAFVDGDVYLADASGGLYRIDSGTGDRVWDYQFNELVVRSSPVVSGSSVLLGLNDGRLVAVDVASGNMVWQGAPSPGLIGPIAVAPDTIVAVKGGRHAGLVAYQHDAGGRPIDVPSPTKLDLARLFGSYALALVAALAVLYLPFRALAARLGPPELPEETAEDQANEEDEP